MQILTFFILPLLLLVNIAKSDYIHTGLTAYYPLDFHALDMSGNDLHGTLTSYPEPYLPGKFNDALFFKKDGNIDTRIDLPQAYSLTFSNPEDFSISLWVRGFGVGISGKMAIFSISDDRIANDIYLGFGSDYTVAGRLTFFVDGEGGVGASAANANRILSVPTSGMNNVWTHIAAVRSYKDSTISLYVNGVQVSLGRYVNNLLQYPFKTNGMKVTLGAFYDSGVYKYQYMGYMDEIRLYSRALSSVEIERIYNLRQDPIVPSFKKYDFGKLLCQADSTAILKLKNTGPGDFHISSIEVSQNNKFEIVNNAAIFLSEEEEFELFIKFKSDEVGKFYDTIKIENQSNAFPLWIYLEGERVSIGIDSLDFGEIVQCNADSTYSKDFLPSNDFADGLIVGDIIFPQLNGASLDLSIKIGDVIDKNNNELARLSISPTQEGVYEGDVIVNFQNCNSAKIINFSASFSKFEFDYPQLTDFGDMPIGERLSQKIVFKANGNAKHEFVRVEGVDYPFILIGSTSSNSINRKSDSIELEIEYFASPAQSSRIAFLVLDTDCGEYKIPFSLSGEGLYTANFQLKPKAFTILEIGKKYPLQVEFVDAIYLDSSKIQSIQFDLTWNLTQAIPNEFTEQNVVNNYISKTYEIALLNPLQTTYTVDTLMGLLGNKRIDLIEVKNLNVVGGLYQATLGNDNITLDDICYEGGERLFDESQAFSHSAFVNGSRIEVNIAAIEKGTHTISIIDQFGNIAIVESSLFQPNNNYKIQYDVNTFSNGLYFYIINTPSMSVSGKFLILK